MSLEPPPHRKTSPERPDLHDDRDALDRPDVVLPGDLALRKVIQHDYHLEHLPSPDAVLHIAALWHPYRSLATAYLFQSAFDRQPLRRTPVR